MITKELEEIIKGIPEFSLLELSPPMTIEEVSKAVYVNWDWQVKIREWPWRACALLDDGLVSIQVRGKDEYDAIQRLKKVVADFNGQKKLIQLKIKHNWW